MSLARLPADRLGPWLALFCASAFTLSTVTAQAQIVEWTEQPGPLGLGYPVPIPVDTPLPFDGFRSYAGLHARHQDLSLTTPWVHGEIVGQTQKGRDIWLYRLGDADQLTIEGLPEPAMLINGGIHAREWQSPEVTTGLMELLATREDDPLIDYLRDNVNGVVIPVLNIDGFLQTQRYPSSNYLGTSPQDPANTPEPSPRDGRMRRKSLLATDEILTTADDHLFGVDLNRNNDPYWASSSSSSSNPTALIYHGNAPASEPETQALQAAVAFAPESELRLFADMHSFSRVFFSVTTNNSRRNAIQRRLLNALSAHHAALPGTQVYVDRPDPANSGIGTTSEYFAERYQVPSWTWEIEPGNGAGSQYGGLRSNGHDGFILPESQIRRVRENLADTLALSFYHMAGPPHLAAAEIYASDTDALLMQSRWNSDGSGTRQLFSQHLQALVPGREYQAWLAFNKPMRWRNSQGQVVSYPGQNNQNLNLSLGISAGPNLLGIETLAVEWQNQPGVAPHAYRRYRDDAVLVRFRISDSELNRGIIQQALNNQQDFRLRLTTTDLSGHSLDANPATPASYANGAWQSYENTLGVAGDIGGTDNQVPLTLALTANDTVYTVEPGISATWFDPSRDGEGIMLEVHPDGSAGLAWLSYTEDGAARWLAGIGSVQGNRIVFPQLQLTRGGVFGPDYDPSQIQRQSAAQVELLFTSCDEGWFHFQGFNQSASYPLRRTSRTMGIDCNPPADAVLLPQAGQSGSWHDPALDGSGVNLQWLVNGRLGLLWFTYTPSGEQVYIFGSGDLVEGSNEVRFQQLNITRGGRFGAAFNPDQVERTPWGELSLTLECDQGTLNYTSSLPGYGSGQLNLERLTELAGLSCP